MSYVEVRLDRTIAAVRTALPEGEVAEFNEAMETTHADELHRTFTYWFLRAALNQAGMLDDMMSDRLLGTGDTIPFDEAFPGFRERWEQERAHVAA